LENVECMLSTLKQTQKNHRVQPVHIHPPFPDSVSVVNV
jgi:hypothetical protein